MSENNLRKMHERELLAAGFAALNAGRIADATACCKEVLARRPDLVPAHFLVGLVALEAGERTTAFSAFRSVTKLEPRHAAAWAHLARLFMSEGQVNRADKALAAALEYVRDEAVVHDLIGVVYSLMGEYGLAQEHFRRAITLASGHPPFMLNYASNLVYHGRTAEAREVFERIVAIQPASPQAHWQLANARKALDRAHIETMQALLDGGKLHPRAQSFYLYAIGKEHEDLGEWEAAFAAFESGARARRGTVEYDEDAEIDMFRFLETHFTPERIGVPPAAAPSDATDQAMPIFVLGQPRTGTTLVDRIISCHSAVHSAGELQQFGLALRRLSGHQDPKRFSARLFAAALDLDPEAIGAMYLETTRRMQGDAPRFVDKLPQNYLMIPLLLAALPGAKIVHLTRDPLDACFASYKQLFADAYLHSYDQREMARHHARYRTLMRCWHERWPGRIYDISYEQTVTDFEPNVRALLDYLGLPFEEACLRPHEQAAAVSTASAVQVREPVHTRSVGRWQRYADKLGPMTEELCKAGFVVGDKAIT